jgi:hypothetical protein
MKREADETYKQFIEGENNSIAEAMALRTELVVAESPAAARGVGRSVERVVRGPSRQSAHGSYVSGTRSTLATIPRVLAA